MLIISGTPTPDELAEAWDEVMDEFSSYVQTTDSKYILDLSKRISALQCDIAIIDCALIILSQGYDKQAAEDLRGCGIRAEYETIDPVKYRAALERASSLAKRKVHDLTDLLQERDRYFSNVEGGGKKTDEQFSKEIAMLSKHFAYYIDQKRVSAFEYAMMLNTYMDEARRLEKEVAHG